MTVYLLEIDAHDGTSVITLRWSQQSKTTASGDTPANTFYDGVISDPGKATRSVFGSGGGGVGTTRPGPVGTGSISIGSPVIANTGALDFVFDYGFGRAFIMKELSSIDALVTSATTIWRGKVLGIESSDIATRFSLRLADKLADLGVPLLTNTYGGTTISAGATADGGADMAGQIIPRVYGSVTNIPAKLTNAFNLIYQFSDGPLASITVYDGALALTNAGNVPNLAALFAAIIPAGSYMTALAIGLVKLGGSPAFAITADVVEQVRTAQSIVKKALADFYGFDVISITSITSTASVGIYIDSNRTVADMCAEVLNSIWGGLVATLVDTFEIVTLTPPLAINSVATLTERELIGGSVNAGAQLFAGPADEGGGIPAWQVQLTWGRIWQTMGETEVAGAVTLSRKNILKNASQTVTLSDASVKTHNPLAVTLTFDTLLNNLADAQAEAARRLTFYKTRRDRFSYPAGFDDGNYAMGQVVTLQMDRFGYDAGKPFLVIGREDDFKQRKRTLKLIG